jgi:hypothetical protein
LSRSPIANALISHHKLIAFWDGVFHHGAQALYQELAKVSVTGKIASSDLAPTLEFEWSGP